VGLFEVTDPAPEALPPAKGPPRLGEVALVIYADPVGEAVKAARAAGATWSPDPILFVMPHRSQNEVCLRDPDGVLINLVERDPEEQNRTAPVRP
jgi:catechol 2,3-dioxygenase-like lactoylglutathione lyase family enzyme